MFLYSAILPTGRTRAAVFTSVISPPHSVPVAEVIIETHKKQTFGKEADSALSVYQRLPASLFRSFNSPATLLVQYCLLLAAAMKLAWFACCGIYRRSCALQPFLPPLNKLHHTGTARRSFSSQGTLRAAACYSAYCGFSYGFIIRCHRDLSYIDRGNHCQPLTGIFPPFPLNSVISR